VTKTLEKAADHGINRNDQPYVRRRPFSVLLSILLLWLCAGSHPDRYYTAVTDARRIFPSLGHWGGGGGGGGAWQFGMFDYEDDVLDDGLLVSYYLKRTS
jgi:hypothetical protein